MLTSILAFFTQNALQVIIGLIVGWFSKVLHAWIRDNQTKKEAQDSVQPLKDAKTGDEIDKATDGAVNGL